MKIIEAIDKIDSLSPNTYSYQEKVGFLSTLDGLIQKNIIDTHQGADAASFAGYTDETPMDTDLLVPAPYDTVYMYWLQAQIHYWNQEIDRYNNAIAMYNASYSEYERYYNRTHMPIRRRFDFFGSTGSADFDPLDREGEEA